MDKITVEAVSKSPKYHMGSLGTIGRLSNAVARFPFQRGEYPQLSRIKEICSLCYSFPFPHVVKMNF